MLKLLEKMSLIVSLVQSSLLIFDPGLDSLSSVIR